VIDKSRGTASQPILHSVSAQLFVAEIRTSCDFFTGKLGFVADFVYGDPPFYAQVTRDNARLALRQVDEPVFVGDIREREELLSASITVKSSEEIESLFLSYQAAKVPFHQKLRTEPWGARTFIVKDPDGNLILFAGPACALCSVLGALCPVLCARCPVLGSLPYTGANIRTSTKIATPAKNTSAIRTPGSRFTSGTRSVAAT
jgi:catechol 2,3-dioxygenase-like lactoylglutathione lyase family enzyme